MRFSTPVRLILLFAALAFGYFVAVPLFRGQSPIRLGIDLVGGVIVSYRPDFSTRTEAYKSMTDQQLLAICRETLSRRLERKLKTIPDVVIRDDQRLVVSIPAVHDYQGVLDLVGRPHHLTLRLVSAIYEEPQSEVKTYGYGDLFYELQPAVFSGDMLDPSKTRVSPPDFSSLDKSQRYAGVTFAFLKPFNRQFEAFTARNIGSSLAILLDDSVAVVATIKTAIAAEAVLTGEYTQQEANDHRILLQSGTMPISLNVESMSTIGPTLGQEIVDRGTKAVLLAVILLFVVLMIAYIHRTWFLLAGVLSLLCLITLMVTGVAAFKVTIDLLGVAGFILGIGMGMDAFILVFEALEGTLRKHESPRIAQHCRGWVERVYSISGEGGMLLHSNLTAIVVLAALFHPDRLRSFAWDSFIGITASVLTIFVTRDVLANTYEFAPHIARSPLDALRGANLKIFGLRKVYGLATVIVLGLAVAILVGVNPAGLRLRLGSDFQPGTQIIASAPTPGNVERATQALRASNTGLTVASQSLGGARGGRYLLTISAPLLLEAESETEDLGGGAPVPGFGEAGGQSSRSDQPGQSTQSVAVTPLPGKLNPAEIVSTLRLNSVNVLSMNSIDSKVSLGSFLKSIRILLVAFGLMALYFFALQGPIEALFAGGSTVSYLPAGAATWVSAGIILALVVDVSCVLVGSAILGIEVGLPLIAGLLTIIGYSVTDSVVLWNHIKAGIEGQDLRDPESVKDVVTSSIDRILCRSMLTSACVMMPAVAIIVLKLAPLIDFAYVMLIGTISGALSSIYVVGVFAHGALLRAGRQMAARPSPAYASGREPGSRDLSEIEGEW